ncbi:MAG: glycosyltransferase family 4 protein [Acidobacteriota bacterium]|nr:glycosyltransferase family 4 protein [Acidobacteriota bacterium]
MLHAVTASVNLGLIRGQLRSLRDAGFLVAAVSGPGDEIENLYRSEGVAGFTVPMERGVTPLADLISFWKLWQLMRRFRPQVTNVGTGKAGLLGGLAARCAGVPCRVYTLQGLSFETARGLKRRVMKFAEKVACDSAHLVICISEGVRKKAIQQGLVKAERAIVLGSGSSNGVDAAHFAASDERRRKAQALRRQLDIPEGAPVIGFVGRMNSERGVPELVCAFARLRHFWPTLRLLLLGDWESVDPMPPDMRGILDTDNRILWPGHVLDPAPYYHLMDVVCLPSQGEGFPVMILEAQAAARPVVATAVSGCTDAIQHGVTGLLVPPDDLDALTDVLEQVLADPAQARRLGPAGRERVQRDFRPEAIWAELADQYRRLLKARGQLLPVLQKKEASEVRTADSRVAAS